MEGRAILLQPDGGEENAIFSVGKLRGAFGQPAFFFAGNRMTIVATFVSSSDFCPILFIQ